MNTRSFISRALILALLVFGFGVSPALAQTPQYQKDFQAAGKTMQEAVSALKAEKQAEAGEAFSTAYQQFISVHTAASEAGDSELANRAKGLAGQLAYNAGFIAMRQENFDTAVDHFNAGIEIYPTYAKNYQGKAIALNKSGQSDTAMQTFVKAAEVGRANGQYQVANKAEAAIREHFIYQASQRLAAENPTASDASAALTALDNLEEYLEPGAKSFYYRAVAYDAQGDFDQAVSFADQALAEHTGSRTDKAKIYFIKGEALMKLGQNTAALQAFENASYGQYESSAQHYIEQLSNT